MSPRAAARLQQLGFTQVYDYEFGKAGWAVRGLPMEGRTAGRRRAIEIARKDIPLCEPSALLGEVRDRVHAAGERHAVVVDDRGVVLGRLRPKAWDGDAAARVDEVMELGPGTVRPDQFLHDVVGRLQRGRIGSILVTQPGSESDGGRFLGLLFRDDVERVLEENERIER